MVDSRFSHCKTKLLPFFDGKGMVWIPLRYKGCLEHWSSSLKKRASFGWLPLLQPSFLQFTRLCQNAGLRAELNLLAVSPETLGPEASPTLYTWHLHSEEAVVKRIAATIARVLPSDTATIAHTQGAQMLAAVKILMDSYVVSTWLRLPVAYLSLLRKVLKLPAFVSEKNLNLSDEGQRHVKHNIVQLGSV